MQCRRRRRPHPLPSCLPAAVAAADTSRPRRRRRPPPGQPAAPASSIPADAARAGSTTKTWNDAMDVDDDGIPEWFRSGLDLDREGNSELSNENKVEILHMVRCYGFTEYDPKRLCHILTRFSTFNLSFFDLDEESTVVPGPPLSELGPSG